MTGESGRRSLLGFTKQLLTPGSEINVSCAKVSLVSGAPVCRSINKKESWRSWLASRVVREGLVRGLDLSRVLKDEGAL